MEEDDTHGWMLSFYENLVFKVRRVNRDKRHAIIDNNQVNQNQISNMNMDENLMTITEINENVIHCYQQINKSNSKNTPIDTDKEVIQGTAKTWEEILSIWIETYKKTGFKKNNDENSEVMETNNIILSTHSKTTSKDAQNLRLRIRKVDVNNSPKIYSNNPTTSRPLNNELKNRVINNECNTQQCDKNYQYTESNRRIRRRGNSKSNVETADVASTMNNEMNTQTIIAKPNVIVPSQTYINENDKVNMDVPNVETRNTLNNNEDSKENRINSQENMSDVPEFECQTNIYSDEVRSYISVQQRKINRYRLRRAEKRKLDEHID